MLLVLAVYASIDGKQCRLPAACSNIKNPSLANFLPIRSIRSIEIGSLTWISFVTDKKQTCLGQGLGVTITARKRPSKPMHVHHEGLRSYAAWSSKLNIDDITLKKPYKPQR